MRYLRSLRPVGLLSLSSFLCGFCVFNLPAYGGGGGEKAPPYVGEVTGNRVNVRSGSGINYRIMRVAEKGDKLIVRGLKNGWAKVDVPESVFVFISRKFVQAGANGTGTVSGTRVNIRPTPSLREPPLCQLKKSETVRIVETVGDFYKVIPPAEAYAWISAKFVRFYGDVGKIARKARGSILMRNEVAELVAHEKAELSKEPSKRDLVSLIAHYDKIIAMSPAETELKKMAQERRAELEAMINLNTKVSEQHAESQTAITELQDKLALLANKYYDLVERTNPPPPPPTYMAKGRIKYFDRLWNRPGTHKLIDEKGKTLFMLKSDTYNLEDFAGKLVGINGQEESIPGWNTKVMLIEEVDVLDNLASR